ncbi:MAG TPA: hypothetical protein VKD90_18770 [Gemmataceae bacterium]|nr:hypothetical protein [Gemmataceae bacterium]
MPETVTVPLATIAHGRSGDKGNHANVAVIAYTAAGFAWLRDHLTVDRVAAYFASLGPSNVERFEAANVLGVNFVLRDVLAGGASRSLRTDTQGKTLALALLQMPVELPAEHAAMTRPGERGASAP